MSTNPSVSLYGPLYGSFFFGAILSSTFYGVACMQTFFYYVHYPHDRLRMKIFVVVLWGLNTIHEALILSGVYKYIMAGLVEPWSDSFLKANCEIIILLTILVTIPTRAFFVYRIYVFSEKNIAAPILWVILTIIQSSTGIIYVGKALHTVNGLQVVDLNVLSDSSFTTLATTSLSAGASMDILIAIFLTFLLFRKRTTSGFASMEHVIQRLAVFAVNTGIWPATFALMTVVLLHIFPSNMYYAVPYLPLCSLYCNTLLANLNARGYIGGEATTTRTYHASTDLGMNSTSRMRDGSTKISGPYGGVEADFTLPESAWIATNTVRFSDVNRFLENHV